MKRNHILYLLCIGLMLQCQEYNEVSNESRINMIDSMPIVEKIYEVATVNGVDDTLKTSHIKKNSLGQKVYEISMYHDTGTTSKTYYWEEDSTDFYNITTNDSFDLFASIQIFKNSKGKLVRMLTLEGNRERLDSFPAIYRYGSNEKNKTDTISIISTDPSNYYKSSFVKRKGRNYKDFIIIGKDTTQMTVYEYEEEDLNRAITNKIFGDSTRSIVYYQEKLPIETQFYEVKNNMPLLNFTREYSYDSSGILTLYTTTYAADNKKDTVRLIYETQ